MKSVFLKNDEYLKNILEQDEDHFKQEVYNGEDEYTLEYEPIDEVMEEETFEVESFEEEAIEMEASSLVSYDTEYLEDYLEEQPAPIVVAPNIEPQNKTSKRIQLEKSKLSPKLKSIKIEMAKPKITIRKSTINLNKSDESNTSKIDKKMSCKLCGMVLSRKENLDNHMVVIHKEGN